MHPCDDDNSNTTGEVCDNGVCEPPSASCPCFPADHQMFTFTPTECGSNFPSYPSSTAMTWAGFGATACSGENCPGSSSGLTCYITSFDGTFNYVVTSQEDQTCRALTSSNCANPN